MLRARPRARGGIASVSGYYIALAGVYGGSFNETTGTSGVIGTATSNLTGTLTWSIQAGGDARISINSSTGAVSTSSAIYTSDSAAFTVVVSNGTISIGFPFTAVGTVGLLLNRLTATATAAYGMRKLRSAYAGSCIRIKRNSDAVETDIGFSSTADGNGDYWVDTAAIAAHSPGGCTITTWYDQTGNSRNATQTTQTFQPAYSATGWASSKPAVVFDGTDNRMNIPDHRASFTNDIGLVAVSRCANASRVLFNTQQESGDNSGANSIALDASNKLYFIVDPTTGGRPQPTTTAAFNNTNFSIIGSYDNTNGALMFANAESPSVAPGSGALNFGTDTTYPWGLGFYPPTASNFWNGPVEELIIFNTAIGSTDRTTIRTSHTAAYGAP